MSVSCDSAVSSASAYGNDVASIARNFAANLRLAMTELGLTQHKLAVAVEVSQSTVSEWLSGTRLPRDEDTWDRVSRVTRRPFEELVRDPSVPVPEQDRDPVVKYLRRQANEFGYDLVKIEKKPGPKDH